MFGGRAKRCWQQDCSNRSRIRTEARLPVQLLPRLALDIACEISPKKVGLELESLPANRSHYATVFPSSRISQLTKVSWGLSARVKNKIYLFVSFSLTIY
jgi:hypothetical protein